MPELKDYLIVGILGSLWIKIYELYIWLNAKFVTWEMIFGSFGLAQLIGLIIFVGIISFIFSEVLFTDKTNGFSMAFIPLTWFYVKDIYNVIFVGSPFSMLLYTFFEGILIAIPIGFFVYYFYWKSKGVDV